MWTTLGLMALLATVAAGSYLLGQSSSRLTIQANVRLWKAMNALLRMTSERDQLDTTVRILKDEVAAQALETRKLSEVLEALDKNVGEMAGRLSAGGHLRTGGKAPISNRGSWGDAEITPSATPS